MKRLLILFTNGFPYNSSEPFLENEYPLYSTYFDKVLISAACTRGATATRQIDGTLAEVLKDHTLSKDIPSVLESIAWVLRDRMFYAELKKLCSSVFSVSKLYRLLVVSLCGNHRAMRVRQWLKKHPEYDEIVLYSYWLHIPAYAAVRLRQKISKGYAISRAHGYDVYAERYSDGYMPFHAQLVEQLDEIACVCENGKAYLEKKYGHGDAIAVYHLGAKAHDKRNPACDREWFRIVTCSRTVSLKRLDRIVDALRLISDRSVEWTHIGSGEAQAALEQYAQAELPANIKTVFTGAVPNEQIYEIYETQPFHLFLNVSETEGLPVSIMEAMSFGIPVVATEVGGTSELVTDGKNGWLIKKEFSDETLKDLICRIMDMPSENYEQFRLAARDQFDRTCSAEHNYRIFLDHLTACADR